jgi:hypothetical protein
MEEEKGKEREKKDITPREGESSQKTKYNNDYKLFEPEIYESWIGGAHKVRSFAKAIRDLQSGDAFALAISDAHPYRYWARVTLDDDPNFVWVSQTDTNSATNKSYAESNSVKMRIQDLREAYFLERKEWREYLKSEVKKSE